MHLCMELVPLPFTRAEHWIVWELTLDKDLDFWTVLGWTWGKYCQNPSYVYKAILGKRQKSQFTRGEILGSYWELNVLEITHSRSALNNLIFPVKFQPLTSPVRAVSRHQNKTQLFLLCPSETFPGIRGRKDQIAGWDKRVCNWKDC